MSILDNLISLISPSAALRREQSRKAIEMLRGYDAARRSSRNANWLAGSGDANTEIAVALVTLRDRARDLNRNNAYAAKAVSVITDNVVGIGIRASSKSKTLSALWGKWAETTACDAQGMSDFYAIQSQVMRAVAVSGEAIVLKRIISGKLALLVLESDYLDTDKDLFTSNGNRIIQGVEVNEYGRPVAYWLYNAHPGSNNVPSRLLVSERHDAADVLHIFVKDRPGQVRGVPLGAQAFMNLRDYDDYEDAELMRKKIAACFSVFITDSGELQSIGGSPEYDEIPSRVAPGIIERLPMGKSVEFASPPPAEGFSEYSRAVLTKISAAFGVTYEQLTNDLSKVNFSSGRMGLNEFMLMVYRYQWQLIVPQLCVPVWKWFVDFNVQFGGVRASEANMHATWTPPRRLMIDPAKEIAATENAIRSGLTTLSEALRELGYNPEEIFNELQSDQAKIDSLGLVLTSDARYFRQGGAQPQSQTA